MQNEEYMYTIIAKDDSKNISPASNIVYAKTFKKVFINPVKILTATYDSVTNSNIIEWEYLNKDIVKIQIFKGDSAHKVMLIPTQIKPTEKQYKDFYINKNKTYFYAIKLYFKDGTQTKLSVPVEVIKP